MGNKKNKYKPYIMQGIRIILIIVGAALVTVSLTSFLIPNDIIDGGIVGISIMGNTVTKIPLGVLTFVLNIPFFVIGYRQIGKSFTLSTIFAVILLSIFLTVFGHLEQFTDDLILATLFGGMILGAGVGLIIRSGGSLDGTEIIAIILDKKTNFSIGEIAMMINLVIYSFSAILFGWDKAMYSMIAYFIASKVIDIVNEGIDEAKAITIISDNYYEIAEAIKDRLGRGVTYLSGKGHYSQKESEVLYVVVSRLEIAKLKSIVLGYDEYALMTIHNVEVEGKKYKKRAIH